MVGGRDFDPQVPIEKTDQTETVGPLFCMAPQGVGDPYQVGGVSFLVGGGKIFCYHEIMTWD